MSIRLTFFVLLFSLTGAAYGIQEVELKDAADEPRFMELSNELRCMVCQNQSIADSNAELARDFRNQVKEKINQGQTNEQIVDYMVQRYGDYILYRPPFNAATALLWTGPFLLIVIGLAIVFRFLRRRDQENVDDKVDESRQQKLQSMLDEKNDEAGS